MNCVPSASHIYGPAARSMKRGVPPTERKARTGELTPPGMTRAARSKRASLRDMFLPYKGVSKGASSSITQGLDETLGLGRQVRVRKQRADHGNGVGACLSSLGCVLRRDAANGNQRDAVAGTRGLLVQPAANLRHAAQRRVDGFRLGGRDKEGAERDVVGARRQRLLDVGELVVARGAKQEVCARGLAGLAQVAVGFAQVRAVGAD